MGEAKKVVAKYQTNNNLNEAKVIKYRYDEETIAFLQSITWWNNSPEWFKEHWELLTDMDKLKSYYNIS